MNNWIEFSIQDELIHDGAEIFNFYYNDYINLVEANLELIKLCKQKHFDLFISSSDSEIIFKETIIEIKRITYSLLLCMDNLHAPFMHKNIASSFDLVWLTSFENKNLFIKWGCKNIIVQPFACNPNRYFPKQKKEVNAINFIGSPYGTRKSIINKFTNAAMDFHLYNGKAGYNTEQKLSSHSLINKVRSFKNHSDFNVGRKLILSKIINKFSKHSDLNFNTNLKIYPSTSFEKMSEIFSNYKISLNIIELRNTAILKNPILKLHLRTFDIPMSGGLMLCRNSEELQNYFEDEKEMIAYDSYEEMIDKAKFYINCNKSVTDSIKMEARKRSLSDHTWKKRFDPIFKNIK